MVDSEHIVQCHFSHLVAAEVDFGKHIFLVCIVCTADVKFAEVVACEFEFLQTAVPGQVNTVKFCIGKAERTERL